MGGTSPDVLCLQEVRAWPDQVSSDLLSPHGHHSTWATARSQAFSGVTTYSKFAPDKVVKESGLSWADEEGRFLRTEIGDLVVVNLYLPSGWGAETRLEAKYAYMDHLESYFHGLWKEGKPTLICGDFNVSYAGEDVFDPEECEARPAGFLPEERRWMSKIFDQGWTDVVRAQNPDVAGLFSYWDHQEGVHIEKARDAGRGMRLDYILASSEMADRLQSAWIETEPLLSDHAPVTAIFDDVTG